MRPQQRINGYTIVELLVVIAIIGILMGLTIPAVYQAKQQMNRAKCGDNLRQLAMARSMSRDNGVFNNQYAGFDPANPTRLVPAGKRMQTDDFKDGRGNTMLYSENQQAQPWYLSRLSGDTAHLTTVATIGGQDVSPYPIESRYLQGAVWHFEDDLAFAGAAPVLRQHKINGGDVYNEFMTSTNFADVARPSSLHVGGVNMAMADGSVHFVVETIDYRAYQALLTPNGRSSDVPMNEFVPTSGM